MNSMVDGELQEKLKMKWRPKNTDNISRSPPSPKVTPSTEQLNSSALSEVRKGCKILKFTQLHKKDNTRRNIAEPKKRNFQKQKVAIKTQIVRT